MKPQCIAYTQNNPGRYRNKPAVPYPLAISDYLRAGYSRMRRHARMFP
jgi:hypothetical protein